MYMVTVKGWTEVRAFSDDIEKAKKMALMKKKELCRNDLDKWSWKNVDEFYGTSIEEVKEGTILY